MTPTSNSRAEQNMLTDMLNQQVKTEVYKELEKILKPTFDKIVKDAAIEATKAWIGMYKTAVDINDIIPTVKVQIQFVENVVNKVINEHNVVVEVKDDSK